MIIKKIFNNNVILTENSSGREIITMGRGIAFGRRVGNKISDESIESIYTLSSKGMMEKFQELVASVSSEYLQAEFKKFYEKEYSIGIEAIKILNRHFAVNLPIAELCS